MDKKFFKSPQDDILTLSEAAAYLKIAEKTLLRMIYRREIPAAKVGNQYRFMRSVIEDWLLSQMKVLPSNDLTRMLNDREDFISIWKLLNESMIILDMAAENRGEVLKALTMPLADANIVSNAETYIKKLLAREEMASTAIENGVALPHLRKQDENPSGKPLIVFGRSREGIDFGAPDGEKTHLFFLLCTDSEVIHLRILRRLSLILRQQEIIRSLREAEDPKDIISIVHKAETDLPGGKP